MREHSQKPDAEAQTPGVNPGYAAFQIARALTTSEVHDDPATRERAKERIARWETVLQNILTGAINYGTRTPVTGAPEWATLEVITGGFATGELVAGGPLQEHERKLLESLPAVAEGEERRALNAYFLTEAGLEALRNLFQTGCYDINVPEEGALLVVAWLVEKGSVEEARGLLDTLSPYFSRLRFYPIPLERPRRFGSRVHLQDVGSTLQDLRKIKPNKRIQAQKEAVEVWAPLYDRMVALFLETIENDWPCQNYPNAWSNRALALLGEYAELRKEHALCGKPERVGGHYAQLREYLGICARKPDELTGRDVGRIRLILNRYREKRGAPDSPTCAEARRRQAEDVSGPTFHAIAGVVVPRLEKHPASDGLDDVAPLNEAVTPEEAAKTGIPEGTRIPSTIQRKVERCLNETVEVLIERDLITSGETLARVLPQMTSGLRAAGIADPTLRPLYAAIYRAFRRRRSLLLLNLEQQVKIEELPWVAVIDRFRTESLSSRELARQTLEEVALLTLTAFPHAILPNKLLQELRALAKGAGLNISLTDELAADIFMGQFGRNFLASAKQAADLLEGSLYAAYYAIDVAEVRRMPEPKKTKMPDWVWQRAGQTEPFAQLCASRAGVSLGKWDPAINGMIIEQQQILTTQNLAALFMGLGLADALRDQLGEMARQCFRWICKRQQVKADKWHARLIMLKNTAYAWRQMLFFLSLLPERELAEFLRWGEAHLNEQPEEFRNRFLPAWKGLALTAEGYSPESVFAKQSGALRFLGWSKERHWLIPTAQS